jgi:hypothetical protein
MKAFFTCATAACLLGGCASNDVSTATHRAEVLDDQPQTSVAGGGTLMPGAYGSRSLATGQFTGRERTNDQVGQRPTLPREADARELARSDDGLAGLGTGAGTLGQSGLLPDEPVSTETLMETTAVPVGVPAHVAVTPPASTEGAEVLPAEAVGAAPGNVRGTNSSRNLPVTNSVPNLPAQPRPAE